MATSDYLKADEVISHQKIIDAFNEKLYITSFEATMEQWNNDINNYYSKLEIDAQNTLIKQNYEAVDNDIKATLTNSVATLEAKDTALENNFNNYYNKTEIDSKVTTLEETDSSLLESLDDYYTKVDADSAISTAIAAIPATNLTNYYNKTELDSLLNSKVDAFDGDSKTATYAMLAQQAVTAYNLQSNYVSHAGVLYDENSTSNFENLVDYSNAVFEIEMGQNRNILFTWTGDGNTGSFGIRFKLKENTANEKRGGLCYVKICFIEKVTGGIVMKTFAEHFLTYGINPNGFLINKTTNVYSQYYVNIIWIITNYEN